MTEHNSVCLYRSKSLTVFIIEKTSDSGWLLSIIAVTLYFLYNIVLVSFIMHDNETHLYMQRPFSAFVYITQYLR